MPRKLAEGLANMNLTTLQQFAPQINQLAMQHGVSNIRVFGSVVRGDANDDSDVDLLVSVQEGTGMKFYGFGDALEKVLGCPVDVLSDRARFLPHQQKILTQAVPLFPDEKAS